VETPPPLPDVFMSIIDHAAVIKILDDIDGHAELLSVMLKVHATAHAEAVTPDLATARRVLADGTLRGLQLRYRFGGDVWADTLMRLPNGSYRLVRVGG